MGDQSDDDFFNSFPELSPTLEYSLNRRFSRTNIIIAEGKYKTVYQGYDHDYGREVAWSRINISSLEPKEKSKLLEDLKFLLKLDHPSLLKLIDCWEVADKSSIITITESQTCTLKSFLGQKRPIIQLKTIKKWCKSILEGIKYLHSRLIIHKNIKCKNIFIGNSSANIRIGILGYTTHIIDDDNYDIKCFAYSLLEMCTFVDLDYTKTLSNSPPRELSMIENPIIKNFICSCLNEHTADSLLLHNFFSSDDLADNLPLKLMPIEDLYEVAFEEVDKSLRFVIVLKKNCQSIGKYEFSYNEDVPELVAEALLAKNQVPNKYFCDFLNAIEMEIQKVINCDTMKIKNLTGPFVVAHEKTQKVQKISINLGIQDLQNVNKIRIDMVYDPELDNPHALAEEIVYRFQLDSCEVNTIAKLITEKITCFESETHSNYSLDFLDFPVDDNAHWRTGLNSTYEFSINSENSSLRNSFEPKNHDPFKNRSFSPIDVEY